MIVGILEDSYKVRRKTRHLTPLQVLATLLNYIPQNKVMNSRHELSELSQVYNERSLRQRRRRKKTVSVTTSD